MQVGSDGGSRATVGSVRLWVGRETGEGEEAVAIRWWGRDGWSEKASPGRCRIIGSSGVAQVAAALGDEKVAQVIGRRVVWRAAMEARRAGKESIVKCRKRSTERGRCRGMNE